MQALWTEHRFLTNVVQIGSANILMNSYQQDCEPWIWPCLCANTGSEDFQMFLSLILCQPLSSLTDPCLRADNCIFPVQWGVQVFTSGAIKYFHMYFFSFQQLDTAPVGKVKSNPQVHLLFPWWAPLLTMAFPFSCSAVSPARQTLVLFSVFSVISFYMYTVFSVSFGVGRTGSEVTGCARLCQRACFQPLAKCHPSEPHVNWAPPLLDKGGRGLAPFLSQIPPGTPCPNHADWWASRFKRDFFNLDTASS